jgi:glycosyltransferase involved in cell wall biosynthesis
VNPEIRTAPAVSVIVAAFNASAYIADAVQSALASRDVSLEVIVVDDDSTDTTWDILREFGESIRAVRQAKGGAYRARNLGASLARGEWLAFLDSDDLWTDNKLASQLSLASAGTDLIYTDTENIGEVDRVKRHQSDSTPLFEGDVFEPLLLNNFIALSSVLIRKRSFFELGGFAEYRSGTQDWDLWLRYAAAGGRVGLVREPLTKYRIHAGQMTKRLALRMADRVAVVERALTSPRGLTVSSSTARQARANVWQIGAWLAAPSEPRTAIVWYLRAARHWPWNMALYKGIVKCALGIK